MEGGGENGEKLRFSLCVDGNSRDLMNGNPSDVKIEEEENEEIQLSLGLSMNGRFGVDPARKKLRRYSSVSILGISVEAGENGDGYREHGVEIESDAPLGRTCSLPSETEEWRHRKVLQSTMSMEARKKRMEKLKNGRLVKDKDNCLDNCNGFLQVVNENENVDLPSQGSIGSQASGSSGISDVQSREIEGTKQITEVKSSSITTSGQDQASEKPALITTGADAQGPSVLLKKAMLEMPFISTKENGSDGNKVDGFLYRYKKGEEVRIVCVCHGKFLSPAEFVKHGGGGDVEHPLKHIVVNPSPLF